MKLSELVTTPKGRKATAKLAWDLSKITGKVAVAGAAGLAGTVAQTASEYDPSEPKERSRLDYARSSDGIGGVGNR